ncbi:MAG: hypothetical protein IJP91_07810 [Synergistaceae bacterium]|nr:hypothetical protein [Synergistaceae bacterium]
MFERIKDTFSRLNLSGLTDKLKLRGSARPSHEEAHGGKIYSAWLFVIPILSGLVLGRLVSVGLGFGLDAFAGNAGVVDSAVIEAGGSASESQKQRGLDGFLTANPFHISPQKSPEQAPKAATPEPEPTEPESRLDDLILRGTFPGVGAYVENKGNLTLLLVGKEIERYKLTSVKYTEAVFTRGKTSITKYITYGPLPVPEKKAEAPKPAATTPAPEPAQTGNIVAAAPGGQEGQVSSETVNQLVQNPFDELKRIRIRPSDSAGGLEVQWIQNDSILKRLGVQKGDVIRSVNGIPFTNMGDIANSINSLMNSERFDVEVTRNGKPEALRYVVR